MKIITKIGLPLLVAAFVGFAPSCAMGAPGGSTPGGSTPVATQPYSWRNVTIEGTGFVPGIVFHPRQRGLMYCRTDIGGAYRWDEKLSRWIPLQDWIGPDDWNLLGVDSIGLDPNDARRVYLAAGTYTNDWAGNGAILRSSDQGKNWQCTNVPFKLGGNEDGRSMGERLAVDPHRGNILFLGTRRDGLWKSDDHGASWKKVESFPSTANTNNIGIGFVVFDPKSGKPNQATPTIYAGIADAKTSLFQSKDGGETWREVPNQPKGFLPHHGILTPGGTLYLSYGNGPGPNGMTDGAVWKLDTKTNIWTNITPQKPNTENLGGFGYAGLAVDASNPNILLAATMDKWSSGDEIFRSTNGGKSWTGLKEKSTRDSSISPYLIWGRKAADMGHWFGDVEIDPFNSNRALYVTGATIWTTNNLGDADAGKGTRWTVGAKGIEETSVADLISPPVGAPLISGVYDVGGFRHDDLTVSPSRGMHDNPRMGGVTGLDFAEQNPSIMARTGRGNKEHHGAISIDGGATWTPFASQPESATKATKHPRSLALSADGSTLVWEAADEVIYFSPDRGATWKESAGIGGKASVYSDRVNARKFYAIDDGKILISTDGGASFSPQPMASLQGARRLRAVPAREGDIWLAADSGLFHSTDSGASMVQIPGVQAAQAVGFGKAAPGRNYPTVFIGGQIKNTRGIFRSDDGGESWVRINDDAHQWGWIGRAVTGDPRVYGRVYVGTNGRGILYGEPIASNLARAKP